jgi:amino acid transporter
MNFAYGFTEVSVLCSICLTYSLGLSNGGNVVILWAFVVQFFCVMFIAHSMAEICSAFPSAGSVYHWSAQLASKEHAPLWSYITGWWNFIGNGLGDAAFAYGFANFLNAGLVASSATPLTAQQQVGVSIAVLWLWSVMNTFRVDQVGWLNNCAAIFQVASVFIVFAALMGLTPTYTSASDVFTSFENTSGFTDVSYVVAGGITSSLFSFAGNYILAYCIYV